MLTLLLLAAAAPGPAPATCPPEAPRLVAAQQAGRPHPLGSEPPAQVYLAVRHTEAGYPRPQPVSERRARGR